MRSVLTIIFLCIFSISAHAESYLMDAVRITPFAEKTSPQRSSPKNCQIHADTPSDQIVRSAWEMEPQWNFVDIPSIGSIQGRTENFGFMVTHNLSSSFGVYARYAQRSTEKDDIPGSAYDKNWKTQEVVAGVHLYITPVIKVFGGGGNVWLENENGEPDLDAAIERGVTFFYPLGDYRLAITYKFVEAKLKDSEADISQVTGDGSYQSVGIGLSIPLNYGVGVSE